MCRWEVSFTFWSLHPKERAPNALWITWFGGPQSRSGRGKVKAKSSPCFLTEHHALKAYWGSGVQLHALLNSALDGGEWSASRHSRFIPREGAPGTHWIGGWVGPRAGLDAVVKRKIPSLCRNTKPRSSSPKPIAIPLSFSTSHLRWKCFFKIVQTITWCFKRKNPLTVPARNRIPVVQAVALLLHWLCYGPLLRKHFHAL
jgi:hypothetical protein